jgi:tetratricopeptide (TPR) repeat protein
LVKEYPTNAKYRMSLAQAHISVGAARVNAFHFSLAEPEFALAVDVVKPLVESNPTDGQARWQLMKGHTHHGEALWKLGHLCEAEDQFRETLTLAETPNLPDEWTNGRRMFEGFARFHLGRVLVDLGRYAEAKVQFTNAQDIANWGFAKEQRDRKRGLYTLYAHYAPTPLAALNLGRWRPDIAEKDLTHVVESLESSEAKGEVLTESVYTNSFFGEIYFWRGESRAALGRFRESKADYEKAAEYWEDGHTEVDRHMLALAHWRIGELEHAQGRQIEANEQFSKAHGLFNELAERRPHERSAHERLIVFLCTCPNEVLRAPDRAALLADQFKTPDNGPMWRYLGLARYRAGDLAGAKEAVEKGMDLRKHGESRGDALDWLLLAAIQYRAAKHADAEESYQHAQQLLAAEEPIYYGHIGVLGFRQIQQEVNHLRLRFFVGFTISEAAKALGVTPRTAENIWNSARTWLIDQFND